MPAKITGINWREIRRERERNGLTYKELGEKFGLELGTIAARARREGWTVLQAAVDETVAKIIPQGEYLERTRERVAEKSADAVAEFLSKSLAQASSIMDSGSHLVAAAHAAGDARAARDAAACWSMGHTGARTALGLDRPGGGEPTEWLPVGKLIANPAPVVDVEEVSRPSGPTPE